MDPKIAVKRLIEAKNQEFQMVRKKASIIESELSHMYNSPTEESVFWSVAVDKEAITKFSQKLLEAEHEVQIYINVSISSTLGFNSENTSLFLEICKILAKNKVETKLLFGGINQEDFKAKYLEHFMPYYDVVKQMEIRFTDNLTNTFDVMDKEKFLLNLLIYAKKKTGGRTVRYITEEVYQGIKEGKNPENYFIMKE